MKQLGFLTICWIVLMSVHLSTVAASTTEPTATTDAKACNEGLKFTKISSNEITVSWNTTCFNEGDSDETSYTVDLYGEFNCTTKPGHICEANPCYISNYDMDCMPPPIHPCSDVTYIVTGDDYKIEMNDSTTAAPLFTAADWKLNVNGTEDTLYVYWGPPEPSNNFASCATWAKVVGICPGDVHVESTTDVIPAELNVALCEEGLINVTVTFMSGEVLTETKSDTYNYLHTVTVSTTTTPVDPTTSTAVSSDITPDNGGDVLSGGEIAGIVIGSLLGGTALIGGGVFISKKNKIGCFA